MRRVWVEGVSQKFYFSAVFPDGMGLSPEQCVMRLLKDSIDKPVTVTFSPTEWHAAYKGPWGQQRVITGVWGHDYAESPSQFEASYRPVWTLVQGASIFKTVTCG